MTKNAVHQDTPFSPRLEARAIDDLKQRCEGPLTGGALLSVTGSWDGPSSPVALVEAWCGDGEALCRLENANAVIASTVQQQWDIVKICFQALAVATREGVLEQGSTWSPSGWEEWSVHGAEARVAWAHVKVSSPTVTREAVGDVALYDELGQLVAGVRGANMIAVAVATPEAQGERQPEPSPPADKHESLHDLLDQPAEGFRAGLVRLLCGVWTAVLGAGPNGEPVSATANFFDLGGDSIKGLQAVSNAKAIGINLSIHELFAYPTINELANARAPSWREALKTKTG